MKKTIFAGLLLTLSVVVVFLLFSRVDAAMQIDSLKEQVKLQRKEMRFLERIANGAFDSCKVSVANFENLVRQNRRDLVWQENEALVGPFKIQRKASCIVGIHVVDGF
jgi:hypothetical protein